MWDQLMKDTEKLNKINETAFSMIDLDSNGQIQRHELQQLLAMTAEQMNIEKPSKQEVKEIMKTLDIENKGYLNKDNFMNLVIQVLKLLKLNEEI